MRHGYDLRLGHVGWPKLVYGRNSKQSHSDDEFVLKYLEDAHQAGNPVRCQSPTLELANGHCLCPKGNRFQDVATALDPTVHHNISLARHRFNHFRKDIQSAEAVVKLASAVVRYPYHVNAVLNKLGAHSRTEAVTRATRMGLIAL